MTLGSPRRCRMADRQFARETEIKLNCNAGQRGEKHVKNMLEAPKELILPKFDSQLANGSSMGWSFRGGGTSMVTGLADPLGVVRVLSRMLADAEQFGLRVRYSSDFEEFGKTRLAARGDRVSPMFDPSVSQLEGRALWIGAFEPGGRAISLEAFRLDIVEPNLAEWVLGWMAGLYIKR